MITARCISIPIAICLMLLPGCNRGDVSSIPANPDQAYPASFPSDKFEAPVRIRAGGEYVAVDAPGYACPTMADVDGDGKQDLVVGQFHNGNMQFCKNVAPAGEPPKFESADWLQSGDKRAIVPGVW